MTATTRNRLVWIGLVLLIAFDMIIRIPDRVIAAILLIAVFWALSDLNKRTEKLENQSELGALVRNFGMCSKNADLAMVPDSVLC